ncbi:hypothetical protein SULI_01480 [Saccharolobus solfataricus]|uniref:Uncharacterized protein n=2 Tax=Saccharolobus solfataricus TaxID=2287 RepID=A0A0E3GSV3_SACSO|nr:hypothetical protein [Saccharolobus solfataricus]AKA72721.1 hypothetical protein SULB_0292 [Saccharolobus solfataricus]AKA75420.1 hypothetical protein SULC_0290 [Saccharolobus solfataricus]AKA78112.1 hypothetical protein SULA_0290 [Saccharolobus solfataricus]AZF67234.1 hypothetical protein SULG_01480 [Saccharolobus solfataricus]AZF69854.1 hypothetical protein SULH_01480 [Saccharolobus solfataricus]
MFKRLAISPIFLILSLIAYYLSKTDILLYSTISTIFFWTFIILILPTPFYNYIRSGIAKYWKRKIFWLIVGLYMAYHVILYSFFFYLLLPGSIKNISFNFSFNAGIGYSIPPPITYFLEWVSNSPAIWFFVGPYEGDIIPFSTFMGIVLALLIGLNVMEILELWGISNKLSKSIVLIPSLGVVSGSSCCVFLPSIVMYSIALSISSITATILSILSSFAYFILAYYALPIVSALVLFHNLAMLNKLIKKLSFTM